MFLATLLCLTGCSDEKTYDKGFQVIPMQSDENVQKDNGVDKSLTQFETQPGNVLLTGLQDIRLTPIYKVNISGVKNKRHVGSTDFHYRYDVDELHGGNNWNSNLIPGLEAVFGYNMVNVSLYRITENTNKLLFDKPVLIKTVYYPTFSHDTLNGQAVNREYFIVSAYNDDTNKDGFINNMDLRRMYLYNLYGDKQKSLVPENYSVIKSDYDPANDFMYVYAQHDLNRNGHNDETEPTHIFWISLKDPNNTGRQY